MENCEICFDDELQHWGIKGQKWGQRRYQNKDGSLTPAGVKRYNKEKEALKKEKAKVKAEEKVLANKKKTQAKIDKLEAEKKALEERKKALKDEKRGKSSDKESDKVAETPEQRRERVLKSNDPKEIYKDRDALTYQELSERVNRIDLETRLQSKIPAEPTRLDNTNDKMKKAADTIENVTNLYKKVDNAYNTVATSAIGKTLAKNLGIQLEGNKGYKWKGVDDFYENMDKMSDDDVAKGQKRIHNMQQIVADKKKMEDYRNSKQKDKADKESGKKSEKKDKESDESKKQNDTTNDKQSESKTNTNTNKQSEKQKKSTTTTERYEATADDIIGEGTSRSNIKAEWEKSRSYNEPVSNVPAVVTDRGRSEVAGLLEDYRRR